MIDYGSAACIAVFTFALGAVAGIVLVHLIDRVYG